MIEAKILADSINVERRELRVTTMSVTIPRFILAELNTHRMFSRNSASSRAIPFEKMVKVISENPFIPIAWQKDHKGMQGSEYETGWKAKLFTFLWLLASKLVIIIATILNKCGATKQLANRLLEPWMWHTVIVTATDWENFFELRCPKYLDQHPIREWDTPIYHRSKKDFLKAHKGWDNEKMTLFHWLLINEGQAEIHMMSVAEAMWDAYNESTPKELHPGEWHVPFLNKNEPIIWTYLKDELGDGVDQKVWAKKYWEIAIKVATARCARVSYTVVGEGDKLPEASKDIQLHDRLAKSGHWSPFEHCAKAMTTEELVYNDWSGNFRGWIQYRKTFNNENITK